MFAVFPNLQDDQIIVSILCFNFYIINADAFYLSIFDFYSPRLNSMGDVVSIQVKKII